MTIFVFSGLVAIGIEITLCFLPVSRIQCYLSVVCGSWAYVVLAAMASRYLFGLETP